MVVCVVVVVVLLLLLLLVLVVVTSRAVGTTTYLHRCLLTTESRYLPPCVAKACADHSIFARVVGELQAADPSKCPMAHEAKC